MNLALIVIGIAILLCVLYVRFTYKPPSQDVIKQINEDKKEHNPINFWNDERWYK